MNHTNENAIVRQSNKHFCLKWFKSMFYSKIEETEHLLPWVSSQHFGSLFRHQNIFHQLTAILCEKYKKRLNSVGCRMLSLSLFTYCTFFFILSIYLTKASSLPVYPSTCVTSELTTDLSSDTPLHLPVSPLFDAHEYETSHWH